MDIQISAHSVLNRHFAYPMTWNITFIMSQFQTHAILWDSYSILFYSWPNIHSSIQINSMDRRIIPTSKKQERELLEEWRDLHKVLWLYWWRRDLGTHFSYFLVINIYFFWFCCKLWLEANRKWVAFTLFYVDSFSVAEEACSRSPCQNGGTCINGRTSFICACRHPFTGRNCTVKQVDDNASAPGKTEPTPWVHSGSPAKTFLEMFMKEHFSLLQLASFAD